MRASPAKIVTALLALTFAAPLFAQDARKGAARWDNWRGPFHNGTSDAKNLPEKISPDTNLLWSTQLPGPSNATPIIVGGRIYISASDAGTKKLRAISVDAATGKIEWNREIADVPAKTNTRNTYASPSAVADDEGAVFLFGTGDMAAFDTAGKVRWQRKLSDDAKRVANDWVYSSSFLQIGSTLYAQTLQRDSIAPSYLIAIDAKDGKTKWKIERPTNAVGESHDSYTTPIAVSAKDSTQIVLLGADYLTGHDTQTGKELWRFGGFNPRQMQNWRIIPTPVVDNDRIYISVARGVTTMAVKVGGQGDITKSHAAWTADRVGTDSPTPALHNGVLYVLDDKSNLHAIEAATGARKGSVALGEVIFYASPTVADGKIYCVNESSEVFVVDPATLKILSQTKLDDRGTRGSISVIDGRLFVRTANKLWCFGSK
jgi:outer membrane protein assembly factor BamB